MRPLLIGATLAILATAACLQPHVTAPAEPDTDAVLRLSGRFVSGHACPISESLALTSAHVTDLRPFSADMPLFPLRWSALGHDGVLQPVSQDASRDLALMKSEEPLPRWYKIAGDPPLSGDRLWILGYEWRHRRDAFGPRVFVVEVIRTVARHVVFYPPTAPGASGACVLNERAEVVAINQGGVETDDHQAVGVAVGVWGEQYAISPTLPDKPSQGNSVQR